MLVHSLLVPTKRLLTIHSWVRFSLLMLRLTEGDTHLTTIFDWSKTVPSNPVVVQFTIRDIFRLLTKRYFPNDTLITNKSTLIKMTLDKNLNKTFDYCYNDCGGKNGSRGTCIPSGHFQFGECRCKPQWSGSDCTVSQITKKYNFARHNLWARSIFS
jgi:hypothetical protein